MLIGIIIIDIAHHNRGIAHRAHPSRSLVSHQRGWRRRLTYHRSAWRSRSSHRACRRIIVAHRSYINRHRVSSLAAQLISLGIVRARSLISRNSIGGASSLVTLIIWHRVALFGGASFASLIAARASLFCGASAALAHRTRSSASSCA